MLDSKIVPHQFVADFEAVASHYRLKDFGEYELAKKIARADIENAMICYAKIAEQLKLTSENTPMNAARINFKVSRTD